jgi:excisionase family DNA binding protein
MSVAVTNHICLANGHAGTEHGCLCSLQQLSRALKAAVMPSSFTPPSTMRYLTNKEAAAFLRLSPRTLEKLRVEGGGPRFHKFGRRVLYAVDDLESWANARSFGMTCDVDLTTTRRELSRA